MKKTKLFAIVIAVLMMAVLFAGCGTPAETISSDAEGSMEATASAGAEGSEPAKASAATVEFDLESTTVYSTEGPNGEKVCSPSDFSLTDEEIQKLKDGNFTAAFCYHLQEDQSNMTKLASAQAQLEEWGIKTVATTTANMVVEQQIADIESVLALKPDVVFVMPIDADALSSTCKKVSEAGSKLVFMEMYANGLAEGTDYVGTVANDYYGIGAGCAHMLAQGLGEEGTVAMCYYDANFYATNQRDEGFKDTMAKYYPNIEIVDEVGFTDQNDTTAQGDAIFANHPDVDGVYASWDIPLEGVISAAKTAGRTDLVCATPDLNDSTARRIAEGDMIVGSAAPRSYEAGQTEAYMAAYALLGKELPSTYCAVPGQFVMAENLLDAYQNMYHTEAPKEIVNILNAK